MTIDLPPPLTGPAPDWMDDALCRRYDPELFYPERSGPAGAAKKVCAQCPVRAKCLEYALANHEPHGVWGGASVRERQKMLNPDGLRTCRECGVRFKGGRQRRYCDDHRVDRSRVA